MRDHSHTDLPPLARLNQTGALVTSQFSTSCLLATRARLGIELKDNPILSVYHHWDGYPSWLGRMLNTHYNTRDKAVELIDGGDMSSCWSDSIWAKELPEGKCAAEYYSLRGEDCPPRLDKDMEEFFSDGEEYSYIFRNGNWFAYDMHQFEDLVAPEPVEIPDGALVA